MLLLVLGSGPRLPGGLTSGWSQPYHIEPGSNVMSLLCDTNSLSHPSLETSEIYLLRVHQGTWDTLIKEWAVGRGRLSAPKGLQHGWVGQIHKIPWGSPLCNTNLTTHSLTP